MSIVGRIGPESPTRVVRYAIANVAPETIAAVLSSFGISGSVWTGIGFGQWGVEPTTFLEVATREVPAVDNYVVGILRAKGESCAYRTIDGREPALLWNDVSVPNGKRLEAL